MVAEDDELAETDDKQIKKDAIEPKRKADDASVSAETSQKRPGAVENMSWTEAKEFEKFKY